jgi:hypothetical protein
MSEINTRMPKPESWTLSAWQYDALVCIRDGDGGEASIHGFPGRAITGLLNRKLIAAENNVYRVTAAGQRILSLRKVGNRIVNDD